MINVHRDKQGFLVTFHNTNRLNCFVAEELTGLLPEFEQSKGSLVRINFKGITFIDTSGFQFLFELVKKSVEYGFPYRLCHVSEEVIELVDRVGYLEKATVEAFVDAGSCN